MYSPGAELMPVRVVDDYQCAIQKFADLPLVSSTYEWVSSTYNFAKQSHPAIQAVFEMAETGVKNIASSTEPLLDVFEPQLSVVNMVACRNLDRLQHKFPIMQQTVDQIMTNAIESIYTKLTEAKDVMDTMLDIGIEAAAESVEVTLCSVRNAVNILMEINMAQMMASSVDKMIFKSDDLLEHFLPITDEEFFAIAFSDRSGAASLEKQKEEPSYYRRLGSLSIKLCSRAYHHSLIKIKLGAQQALFQLEQLFYLLKYTKEELDYKVHRCQEKMYQMWKEWYKGQPKQDQSSEANQAEMESRALVISYTVAQKMQEVCQNVITNMQSLPKHLQKKIQQAQCDLEELQAVLSTATSFQDLPSGFLEKTSEKINKARKTLHEVMEYIAKYTCLSWVDGPYCPVEYSAEKVIKHNNIY
ncbi:perilipin-3-like [Ahaetulla prasina]|uniref:perilipin-3-like n=1 Tax=Ahaetulla prasina TaxID=499056 RepID=UPI00264959DF|nr:perilipin-3-like [Ahaetulla prasina]